MVRTMFLSAALCGIAGYFQVACLMWYLTMCFCSLWISAFVSEISSAVITVVFNMLLLNIAGNIGVAAYGVIANLAIVAISIFNGLAQGSQPLISQCYGRKETKNVKQLLKWSVDIISVIRSDYIYSCYDCGKD